MTWFDPRVYGFIFYHHDRNLLKSWLFQIHAHTCTMYIYDFYDYRCGIAKLSDKR